MKFKFKIQQYQTEENLLFQTAIDLGIELSTKIERTKGAGKTILNVVGNYFLTCFDEEVNETTITEIAKQHPYYLLCVTAASPTIMLPTTSCKFSSIIVKTQLVKI